MAQGARGRSSYRPGAGAAAEAFYELTGVKAPKIVAWEITRSCNLACAHCRAAAHCEPYPGELSLDECKAVIDDIASITDPILILTGGEPLMRADIWDIIDYAFEKGLHPVIGTNGTLIDDEMAAKIAEHGIPRVSISLDFPHAQGQDAFRGQDGAFEQTLAGIRNLQAHGVGIQVNSTITKMNNQLVDELHDLSEQLGAVAFHPFLLVPTGRGEDLVDVELSPDEYEEVLTWAYHRQKTSPMGFKPTDAPQYYRIMRQQAAAEGIKVTPQTHGMQAITRGCLGGISFVFISHIGDVQPCGYFDMQLGNVREHPLSEIWLTSKVFDDLRHYDRLKGKCGACEYKGVCGGCRARALSVHGDYLAEEPYCAYVPRKLVRQKVLDAIQSGYPLASRPYDELAKQLELSADEVKAALVDLMDSGDVRRIGASLDSRKLGYTATLCALAVELDDLERVAAIVGDYEGVTHNYGREGDYNLWFTLITRDEAERARIIAEIEQRSGYAGCLDMPVERMYKIRVDFGKHQKDARPRTPIEGARAFDAHDPFDVELVRIIQDDVARDGEGNLIDEPFAAAAKHLNALAGCAEVDEGRVIARIQELKSLGVVRRFGAMVAHRSIGYKANAMTVWDVADDVRDELGGVLASHDFVSHCYARRRSDLWHPNVYAMVHARDDEELAAHIDELKAAAVEALVPYDEVRVLKTTAEYKKSFMKYFAG